MSIKAAIKRLNGASALVPAEFPDWARILGSNSAKWNSARAAAKNGPKILIANGAGMDAPVTIVDSLLAVALTLRGADVHILVCDEALPACWMALADLVRPESFALSGPSEALCGKCFATGYAVFNSLGLRIHRYGDFLSPEDAKKTAELAATIPIKEIASYRLDGAAVGEQALAGALRYYARGSLDTDAVSEAILRRYFQAALLTAHATSALLRSHQFSRISAMHGIYVPEGVVGEVARRQGVPFAAWSTAYRKHCFVFSHHDTYHHTFLTEPTEPWENMAWTAELENDVVDYLKSRWYGTRDWIGYVVDPLEDVSSIAAELGVDFSKPCIGLLTNVIWDAQVHYGGNAFPTMLDWTLDTIKYFAGRPDLQLIIRIHPAEVRQVPKSRQLMSDAIKRAFPSLPKNVFVIGPESSISTYATMLKCNAVIIYGTKTGVELASAGVPVIVAGEAWIRNKGLTSEASSAAEYFDILDKLPFAARMSDAMIQRARKYAYHFFFRRMIPLPFLEPTSGAAPYELKIANLDELLPGRFAGLDVICDGILNGKEFIYSAEHYPVNVVETGKFSAKLPAPHFSEGTQRPLVSVIIPTHNRAPSLQEALDSIYAQEGLGNQFEMEVFIVDDASSDNTAEVARRYGSAHYIRLDKNLGASAARNIGIKASKGKYICFLDDDDLWLPQRVVSHLPVLETYSQFDVVYGQFIGTGFGKDALWPDAGRAPGGWVFKSFLMEEFVFPSFLMARREAFEKAGTFDESLRTMEHYDMFLRLAFHSRFAFVAGPVAVGRFSYSGLFFSCVQAGHYQKDLPLILNRALRMLPDNQETKALGREAAGRWFRDIIDWLHKQDNKGMVRSYIVSSLTENPWMITDGSVRARLLAYASQVLFQEILQDPGSTFGKTRSFCDEIKSTQKRRDGVSRFELRRFLGEILTVVASQLLDARAIRAAGCVASYAMVQDFSQVPHQIRGASRRAVRAMVPGFGS